MVKKSKQPKFSIAPHPEKSPRVASPPPIFQGGILAWRFNAVDKGGAFAWTNLSDAKTYKAVVEKLVGYETMSDTDLIGAGCHSIDLENLCPEAQQRLIDIKLDDLDSLFSFRLMQKVRVFGVVRREYLRILWYDPEHEVCPSKKK